MSPPKGEPARGEARLRNRAEDGPRGFAAVRARAELEAIRAGLAEWAKKSRPLDDRLGGLMRVAFSSAVLLTVGLAAPAALRGAEPAGSGSLVLSVEAGAYPRKDTPVRAEVPSDRLGKSALPEPEGPPARVLLRELRDGEPVGEGVVGQADRARGGGVRLTWILPGETPANAVRAFRVEPAAEGKTAGPWAFSDPKAGGLELSSGGRTVFRYNMTPVSNPGYGPIQNRDAYIHPAFSPSGACVTGDYSSSHPHHRGFFLAYAKAEVGPLHPDFWNIHNGTGKVHFDRLEGATAGPVTARFVGWHRWEAKDPAKGAVPVLQERWEVEAYDIPGSPYWLFDLTSTQLALGEALRLIPYRYGGMAYRGPEPFVKGKLDVLTSEGLDRSTADQKPARWVDLTGPVADGSSQYAGAAILDHPSNRNHPTVARIHPTRLPFFCFVPAHDVPVEIGAEAPTVFRYRVLIHDGHPDRSLDERLWRDFAEPPKVTVAPTPG